MATTAARLTTAVPTWPAPASSTVRATKPGGVHRSTSRRRLASSSDSRGRSWVPSQNVTPTSDATTTDTSRPRRDRWAPTNSVARAREAVSDRAKAAGTVSTITTPPASEWVYPTTRPARATSATAGPMPTADAVRSPTPSCRRVSGSSARRAGSTVSSAPPLMSGPKTHTMNTVDTTP